MLQEETQDSSTIIGYDYFTTNTWPLFCLYFAALSALSSITNSFHRSHTLSHLKCFFLPPLFIVPQFALPQPRASSSPRNGLQSKSGEKQSGEREEKRGSIPSVHLRFMRGCHEHFRHSIHRGSRRALW